MRRKYDPEERHLIREDRPMRVTKVRTKVQPSVQNIKRESSSYESYQTVSYATPSPEWFHNNQDRNVRVCFIILFVETISLVLQLQSADIC